MDPNDIKNILPPSVVENLLGPASDAIGKALGGALYWSFGWLIKRGIIKKAEFDDLARKTNEKYQQIPETNRSNEKSGLALKALEESKYQLNEEILREMFSQLIANSVDNRRNNDISPRFATVLSQLSGTDAKFFKFLVQDCSGDIPYGYLIEYTKKYVSYYPISDKYYLASSTPLFAQVPQPTIDTLSSLGLINHSENKLPAGKEFDYKYSTIEKNLRHQVSLYTESHKSEKREPIEFKQGNIEVSEFGKKFANAIL